MTESDDFNSAQPLETADSSTPRWRKILLGSLAVVTLLFGAAYWLPSPKVTIEPVNYVRNADGSFSVEGSKNETSGVHLAFDSGTLNATNSVSFTSGVAHSWPGWFPSKSIMVVNGSDHLLVQRAADSLVEGLKKDSHFQSVQYYPTGTAPQIGRELPDLFVTINLESIEFNGLTSSELEARLNVTVGTELFDSKHSYSDNQSLPLVEFNGTMRLTHQSTLSGIESSGARYRMQGQNIGERLAKGITERLAEIRKEHQPSPVLPIAFHPAKQEIPEFDFLKNVESKLELSGYGPMVKNKTIWRVGVKPSEASLLKSIHAELHAADWKGSEPEQDVRYLRMSTDGQVLTACFVSKTPQFGNDSEDAKTDQEQTYWISYQSLLTKSERTAAYESLLTDEADNGSVLLALKGMATPDQYSRMIARLKTDPPTTVEGWTTLASDYFRKKQSEEAIHALQCAHVLSKLKQGKDNTIHSLISKHKLTKNDVLKITPEALKAVGVINATELQGEVQVKSGPERMAAIAAQNRRGGWDIVALQFDSPNPNTNGTVEHTYLRVSDGGSSWTQGTWHSTGRWEQFETIGDLKIRVSTTQSPEKQFPDFVNFDVVSRNAEFGPAETE